MSTKTNNRPGKTSPETSALEALKAERAKIKQLEADKTRLELQLDEALAEQDAPIAIPLVSSDGYARRVINMRLTKKQAEQLNEMRAGLNAIDARTEDDRHVDSTADAIRYLIEMGYQMGEPVE